MKKEQLIKELEKYNTINKYLTNIKQIIEEDIRKIAIINNNLNQTCNIISIDSEMKKKLLTNQNAIENMIKKITAKINNITMQLNGIN